MVFAKIMYLAERERIKVTLADVQLYLKQHTTCIEIPLTFEIIKIADTIDDIPELHDRLIAATAVHLQAPLITTDMTISASSYLQTVW